MSENWQDIATAPKDGTYVLVYRAKLRRALANGICVEHYDRGQWCSGSLLWPGDPDGWMPLPSPPREGGR